MHVSKISKHLMIFVFMFNLLVCEHAPYLHAGMCACMCECMHAWMHSFKYMNSCSITSMLSAMTYECTVYLDVCHLICLVFDLQHSGEAGCISLIDFLWTSTGTKSYQWVDGSTFDCDCLHQLWWCFCHVSAGTYWCCSVLGLSNLCYSVSWNL